VFEALAKSRLRVAVAMLFFLVVFLVSVARTGPGPATREIPSGTAGRVLSELEKRQIPPPENRSFAINATIALITAIISGLGTISTLVLAWRADKRASKESELKVTQLQQQVLELQLKLEDAKPRSQGPAT
jgi:hypothetical protein